MLPLLDIANDIKADSIANLEGALQTLSWSLVKTSYVTITTASHWLDSH